VLETTTSGT